MQDSSKIFKQHPKYGKQHLMAENSYHLREMIEQCSRCSLPTASKAADQKSENVKLCEMSISITDPIFISIGCIKLPLFEQKLGTCATSIREKFVRMGKVLFAIFYSRSKIREIAFHDKNIVTT